MGRRSAAALFVATTILAACSDTAEATDGGAGPSATSDPSAVPSATATGSGTPTPSPSSTGTGGPSTPASPEPTDSAVAGVVAAHNAVRAAVSPAASPALAPMAWSEEDAAVARAHAAKCVFQHNAQRGPRGENIYASGGAGGKSPRDVVTSWASEAKNYDYAQNRCSGTCGHYTQVVWRESVKLGCAAQKCTTGSPFGGGAWELWVCDYSPAGNMSGRRPY